MTEARASIYKLSCRPGQRGTTGQLIFSKCEDPPEKCKCQLEEPKPSKKLYRCHYNYFWSEQKECTAFEHCSRTKWPHWQQNFKTILTTGRKITRGGVRGGELEPQKNLKRRNKHIRINFTVKNSNFIYLLDYIYI